VFRCNDVPYRYIRKGILMKSCVMLRTYSGKKTRYESQERLLVKKKDLGARLYQFLYCRKRRRGQTIYC
jgi:hypothetical protein